MTAQQTAKDMAGDPSGTDGMRRLHRSGTNRVLAGVCGGIAEYYRADARAVRLLAILVALFTGIFPMLFVYLIAAVILPAEDAPVGAGAGVGAGQLGIVLGGLLIVIGAAGIATVWLHVSWDMVWPVALIAFGALTVALALRDQGETS
jgi:phage shock protein C